MAQTDAATKGVRTQDGLSKAAEAREGVSGAGRWLERERPGQLQGWTGLWGSLPAHE